MAERSAKPRRGRGVRREPDPDVHPDLVRLRLARILDERTDRQLAEAAGINPKTLNDTMTSARYKPSFDTVDAIRKALGLPWSYFG